MPHQPVTPSDDRSGSVDPSLSTPPSGSGRPEGVAFEYLMNAATRAGVNPVTVTVYLDEPPYALRLGVHCHPRVNAAQAERLLAELGCAGDLRAASYPADDRSRAFETRTGVAALPIGAVQVLVYCDAAGEAPTQGGAR